VFRVRADSLVEELRVVADEDAPGPGFHPVQDDGRGLCGAEWRLVAEVSHHLLDDRPHFVIGCILSEQAQLGQSGACLLQVGRGDRFFAVSTSGVRHDVGAHVSWHHENGAHFRRIGAQVLDEALGEPAHGELGRGVGGVRNAGGEHRPEAVDAARVDQDAVAARDQQRQERTGTVVDAPEVDGEGAFPLFPAVVDEAGGTADARVGEDQVDVLRAMRDQQFVAEAQHR
jgi:hypothetical protein